ncbi:MAG: hypothetical protein IJW55_07455 [Clostridia bacterium]|nr:hypothetical protein [Clostridia bacterium]
MFFNRKKRNDKVFSQYPCSCFLHNALRFISEGKADIAYEEICWALMKGGEELFQEEKTRFEKLRKERGSE